jgi:hypothetical protein
MATEPSGEIECLGVVAPEPYVLETEKLKDWLEIFKVQRPLVEIGIRQGHDDSKRRAVLGTALELLPEHDFTDSADLDDVFTLLDDKLVEMVDVIKGYGGDRLARVKLPCPLDGRDYVDQLNAQIARDERRFLFEGGIREKLYQYRDQGVAMVAADRRRLLKKLYSGIDQVRESIIALNAYLVVTDSFALEQNRLIEQMLQTGGDVEVLYDTVLTAEGEASITSLLKANGYQLRTQFTVACGRLCLRLFGHVSDEILQKLLMLKSIDYLNRWDIELAPDGVLEAERKRLERDINAALSRMPARSKQENWPVLPLLQLFSYNLRYGRSIAQPR